MAIELHVLNKESVPVGRMAARIGLHTTYGKITRLTDKTVWTEGRDGVELRHRAYDGRLPGILLYRLTRKDKIAAGVVIETKGADHEPA